MLRCPAAVLAVLLAAVAPGLAQEGALPDRLTFGYEDEGKVDASSAACEAYVKASVEWNEADMKQAIADVCAARKQHVDAYTALRPHLFDVRIEAADSIVQFQSMVVACIDHKRGLTPGGHNIRIDIIANEIAAACLNLGAKLLADEAAWFGSTQARSSP